MSLWMPYPGVPLESPAHRRGPAEQFQVQLRRYTGQERQAVGACGPVGWLCLYAARADAGRAEWRCCVRDLLATSESGLSGTGWGGPALRRELARWADECGPTSMQPWKIVLH